MSDSFDNKYAPLNAYKVTVNAQTRDEREATEATQLLGAEQRVAEEAERLRRDTLVQQESKDRASESRASDEPQRPDAQHEAYLREKARYERDQREAKANQERDEKRAAHERAQDPDKAATQDAARRARAEAGEPRGSPLTSVQQQAIDADRAERHKQASSEPRAPAREEARPTSPRETTDRQQEVSDKQAARVEAQRKTGVAWYLAKKEIERSKEREGGGGRER